MHCWFAKIAGAVIAVATVIAAAPSRVVQAALFFVNGYNRRVKSRKRKLISELSALTIISHQDIADIILVWISFKPAAMVEVSYFPENGISKAEFTRKVKRLKEILEELDLAYKIKVNYPQKNTELTEYSYITRDKATLRKIISANALKDVKTRRMRVGELLGYPKTAIEAFAKNEYLAYRKLPKAVLKNKYFKFINFRLSKNWRKEMIYAKKRGEIIRKVSLRLYNLFNKPE